MQPRQLTTAREAVARIRDGAIVSFNGIGMIGLAEQFFLAAEERFLSEGHPRDMTLYSACGLGGREGEDAYITRLAHPGMVSCAIVGYIAPYAVFAPAILSGKMEGYNLPQGIISTNYREAAAGRPGFLSKVGLHTFADPRYQGCALNDRSKQKLVELREVDGEEYLFYRTVRPDVCVLRGTTADPSGNVTFEKEVNVSDSLSLAMAVHNNGGLVMVQVERLSDVPADPKNVRVPGALIDCIWVSPNQRQTNLPGYNPYLSGECRAPREMVERMCWENLNRERAPGKPLTFAERIIARRAALELRDSFLINLGIGTPMLAASEAMEMGLLTAEHHVSIETGVMGGIPVPDAFGAVINADAIYDMAAQFDLYEGGGLDASFVGAMEIDRKGNVNVSRKGMTLMGVGGFHHVTQAAKKIVVCSKLRRGSGYAVEQGQIKLLDGTGDKFVEEAEYISLNAPYFRSLGKRILYVTERAVFELEEDGLVMIEVAPGLHPYFGVQALLPFPVRVHSRLRPMPEVCFRPLVEELRK